MNLASSGEATLSRAIKALTDAQGTNVQLFTYSTLIEQALQQINYRDI